MVGSVGVSGLLPSLSGLGGQKPPSFNQIDADNDGTISLEEFKAAAKMLPVAADSAESGTPDELFAKIDTDGDGLISKDEATSFRSKFSAQVQALMLQIQEHRGTAGETTAKAGVDLPSADDIFAKLDTDANGSITKDEFTAAFNRRHHADESGDRAAKLFSRVDTDGDGSISKEENQAFVDHMQTRHHRRHAWLSKLASQSYADASAVSTSETDTPATTTASQSV